MSLPFPKQIFSPEIFLTMSYVDNDFCGDEVGLTIDS